MTHVKEKLPLKILYCDLATVQKGGADTVHNYELVTNLTRLGHKVVSLKVKRLEGRVGASTGIQSSPREHTKRGSRSLPLYNGFLNGMRILRFAWREWFIFVSVLIAILKRRRQLDIIYRRHNVLNSEYFLAKLFSIPLVKEVNGIFADEARMQNVGGDFFVRVIDTIERFNMSKADRIVVVTSKLKDFIHRDYGVPQEKVVVISNGANTDLFQPLDPIEARNKLDLSQSDNYVCFVGSLKPWQGVEYLIKSAPLVLAECPDTKFVIVGDGVMRGELVAQANRTGVLGNVIFTGFVPYEKVPLYVNASDICVAPSRAERNRTGGSPLKLCEYLACERPVVASEISGHEFIESELAGILVTPDNPQELANAIIKLLQAPGLRAQMGENGRRFVVENRSWKSVAKEVAQVCQQLVEDRRGATTKIS